MFKTKKKNKAGHQITRLFVVNAVHPQSPFASIITEPESLNVYLRVLRCFFIEKSASVVVELFLLFNLVWGWFNGTGQYVNVDLMITRYYKRKRARSVFTFRQLSVYPLKRCGSTVHPYSSNHLCIILAVLKRWLQTLGLFKEVPKQMSRTVFWKCMINCGDDQHVKQIALGPVQGGAGRLVPMEAVKKITKSIS